MSAPVVAEVFPPPDSTDAVLRTRIWVRFDQPVDPASVHPGSFTLLAPADTTVLNPAQALDPRRRPQGTRAVPGRIVQESPTRFAFVPAEPLEPQTRYRVLVLGGAGSAAAPGVRNPAGEVLAKSYQWSFTTGTLDLEQPPASSPVNLVAGAPAGAALADWMRPQIDPSQIEILPAQHPDGTPVTSLPFQFEIRFPGPVDASWLASHPLQVWLEPPVACPAAQVPADLEAVAAVSGDRIVITLRRR